MAGAVRGSAAEKAFLLFDGHTAHKATKSKILARRLFHAFSTVPHSSDFNSIETVWSVAKRNFQKLIQYHPAPVLT